MKELLPYLVVGLVSGSVYGLSGVGLVLTYKTSGIFNLAHGAVAAAVAFFFYQLHDLDGVAWPLAAAVCLFVVSPVIGLVLELLARRLAHAPTIMKIVATLGIVVGIEQLAIIRYGTATRQFPPFLPTTLVRIGGVNVRVDQLISIAVALIATVGLYLFFRMSRVGLEMRGVVDNAEGLSLSGTSPIRVRRWAWVIGTCFAGLSGLLLAPTLGLDAALLTLLVVQAFGACAVGLFTSLPLTYLGGLIIGVGAAVSTKYVASVSWLAGIPPSLPFIVLFAVLVLIPARKLVEVSHERRPPVTVPGVQNTAARLSATAAAFVLLGLAPLFAPTKIPIFTEGLAYAIVFLSLSLLERTSGQISLAQLGFAAVGAASFSHLSYSAGIPWLAAVVLGGLVAVPVGALVAVPAIRLSGLYLALSTFGFGLLLQYLLYGTTAMFGGSVDVLVAPRPVFASSYKGYYYVVLVLAATATAMVALVRRARLGRLLRAMADSPVALSTYGTNTTVIKVIVFCLSAFLAGIGGALLGPVTGQVGAVSFGAFQSLTLVVILALQVPFGDLSAPFGAAFAMTVLPSYITNPHVNQWLPVLFGVGALIVAARSNTDRFGIAKGLVALEIRPNRSASLRRGLFGPANARLAQPGRLRRDVRSLVVR